MFLNDINYYIFLGVLAISLTVLKDRRHQVFLLLMASYWLYITHNSYQVVSLVLATLITFYCGKFMEDNKRLYLTLAIFVTLGQLTISKYSGCWEALGISYFTFMSLGYVIEVYREKIVPVRSLPEYALFVAFFPVIASGPIIRARDFFCEFASRIKITPENLQHGIALITLGLIMKLAIADNLGSYVDPIFADPIKFDSNAIKIATLAFGIQLYCDFGGYSNIALGCARVLGFKFPANFNMPYLALSPRDFWHRWNISLSTWLRDYLYISLGGNRKGKLRTHMNLITTMVVCGLWHGATLNFLVWGVYHGILLSISRMMRLPENRIFSIVGFIITQYFVFLGWLIFKISDHHELINCLRKFLTPNGLSFMDLAVALPILILIIIVKDKILDIDWAQRIGSMRYSYWFIYLVLTIMLIYWCSPVAVTEFIYTGF